MKKETKLKIRIAEAAAKRYVVNRRFTIQSLGDEMDLSTDDIYKRFASRRSMLEYYYVSRLILLDESKQAMDGYKDYTLSEKLSHLVLTLLDSFDEQRKFVKMTYKEYIVLNKYDTHFKKKLTEELKAIFTEDERISTTASILNNRLLYRGILLQFYGIISYWTRDTSRNCENSMALTDKWSALIEEVFYTKIIDKSADLGKFLWMHSPLRSSLYRLKSDS